VEERQDDEVRPGRDAAVQGVAPAAVPHHLEEVHALVGVGVLVEPAGDRRAGLDTGEKSDRAVTRDVVVDRHVDEGRGRPRPCLGRAEGVEPRAEAVEGAVAAHAHEVREALRRVGARGLVAHRGLEEAGEALAAEVRARVEHPAAHRARGDALPEELVSLVATDHEALDTQLRRRVGGQRAEALGGGPHFVAASGALLGEGDGDRRVAGGVAAVEDRQ
jgi:hypothetical protein